MGLCRLFGHEAKGQLFPVFLLGKRMCGIARKRAGMTHEAAVAAHLGGRVTVGCP
jgi:hypothetical protein